MPVGYLHDQQFEWISGRLGRPSSCSSSFRLSCLWQMLFTYALFMAPIGMVGVDGDCTFDIDTQSHSFHSIAIAMVNIVQQQFIRVAVLANAWQTANRISDPANIQRFLYSAWATWAFNHGVGMRYIVAVFYYFFFLYLSYHKR